MFEQHRKLNYLTCPTLKKCFATTYLSEQTSLWTMQQIGQLATYHQMIVIHDSVEETSGRK